MALLFHMHQDRRGLYLTRRYLACVPLMAAWVLLCGNGYPAKPRSEKGRYTVFVNGREVGWEKYSIEILPDGVRSSSTSLLRVSGADGGSVRAETQLKMDGDYMPQSYQVRTSAGGRNGRVEGTFLPGQAEVKYLREGSPGKIGLLLDDYFVILDSNVFHHFIFIGRVFDFEYPDAQSLEVVVPQELDNGTLTVRDAGSEMTGLRGKERRLRRLLVDTGKLSVDLWLDDRRVLHKISLPAGRVEVVRQP